VRGVPFLVAALALLGAQPAQAKFGISLTVQPAQVWARQPAKVIVRTGIVLPRQHGLELDVVGPWHAKYGTSFFEPRLRRIGSKTYVATVRFPRGGRWRLIVPNWGAPGSASPPPVDRAIRVQPAP
jgi:hypothetical protein